MSRSRIPLLVALVAGLVAIVALVATGRPLAASRGHGGGLPPAFWDYLVTSAVILLALLVVGLVAAAFMTPSLGPSQKPKVTWKGTLRTVASLLAFALIVLLLHRHYIDSAPTSGVDHNPGPPIVKNGGAARTVQFRWEEAAGVAALLLAALAVFWTRRRRSESAPLLPVFAAPKAVAMALDVSLDDLRSDPDLRRAIVAAYARMEAALASSGIPRRPAEAPLEYLERALTGLHTSGPAVRRLTDLFEWARFSQHEPDAAMKDEAVDALEAVRDELLGPASVAA